MLVIFVFGGLGVRELMVVYTRYNCGDIDGEFHQFLLISGVFLGELSGISLS